MYGNHQIVRALEVALAGAHSLVLIGNEDNLSEKFRGNLKKHNIQIIKACRCGNISNAHKPCNCSVAESIQYQVIFTDYGAW